MLYQNVYITSQSEQRQKKSACFIKLTDALRKIQKNQWTKLYCMCENNLPCVGKKKFG